MNNHSVTCWKCNSQQAELIKNIYCCEINLALPYKLGIAYLFVYFSLCSCEWFHSETRDCFSLKPTPPSSLLPFLSRSSLLLFQTELEFEEKQRTRDRKRETALRVIHPLTHLLHLSPVDFNSANIFAARAAGIADADS